MSKQELAAIAQAIVAPGKDLLAMDESNSYGRERDAGSLQGEDYAEWLTTPAPD
jgi:hypothetical protein